MSALLSVLAVAIALPGQAPAAPPGRSVRIVPVPHQVAAWRWSAACPLGGVAPRGCRAAGPVLGVAQLNGDEWNLGGSAGEGAVEMGIDAAGAVTIDGRLAAAPPCTSQACLAPEANTWVRGYPNVLYGIDQCRAQTSPPTSPRLRLPARLDGLSRLAGVTAYSTRGRQVTYDVAYDLWLQPSATARPCRTRGTLEIVVMTDYSARAVAPVGERIATAEIPSTLDGRRRRAPAPWSVYASNIGGNGWTAGWGGTLWFVPPRAAAVRAGRVGIDLGAVLAQAARVLRDRYGWQGVLQRYWLDTVAFGVEYGPHGADAYDAGPARFSARISAYCLGVDADSLIAACG